MNSLSGSVTPESWDLVNRTAFTEFETPEFGRMKKISAEKYQYIKERLQEIQDVKIAFDDNQRIIRFSHHPGEIKAIIAVAGVLNLFPKTISVQVDSGLISLGNYGHAFEMIATSKGRDNFKQWEKECYDQASTYFKKHSFQAVNSQDAPKQLSFEQLLEKHEGFCIGEFHNETEPKQYLINNMQQIKEMGLKILYLEHVFFDSMQNALDKTLRSEDPRLSAYCVSYLQNMDDGYEIKDKRYGFAALVQTALSQGIRVVGIDTTGSYHCGTDDVLGVEDSFHRRLGMNFVASVIMRHEQEKGNHAKYVALMGRYHILTEDKTPEVPGVAEIMQVPAVTVENINDHLVLQQVKQQGRQHEVQLVEQKAEQRTKPSLLKALVSRAKKKAKRTG